MALLSLSMKRHLGEEFPIAPPSPPQSPVFCPNSIRLLSGLNSSTSLTSLSENHHPKKRRKQEHPLFLTESMCKGEGASDSSADELEKFQAEGKMGAPSGKMGTPPGQPHPWNVKDINDSLNLRDKSHINDSEHNAACIAEERTSSEGTNIISSQSFDERTTTKPFSQPASNGNVPLLLLSQVASDTIGHLSSASGSMKLPVDMATPLKQEEEFTVDHGPSDGELPTGGDQTTDGPAEVCPDCKKVFKRKIYLQRHIAREHWSLAKIFKCEKCAYETKHQSNLLVHRRTHTGERPYHCGACGQRYTQGHLLKAHIRSRHGADMRFYNMDKRTDGMRCRRLLSAKLLGSVGGGAGGGKEDRIRFILQAAEAARQHPAPTPPTPRPMFGGMMPPAISQYMNVLSCLPNSIRPMLWPSLSGGLLGNPGGFQASNSLHNGMPSHAALLSSLAAPLSLSGAKMSSNDLPSKASGSVLSSMLTLPSSAMPLQAIKMESFPDEIVSKTMNSSPDRSGIQSSLGAPLIARDFPSMPEDLTTTKRGAVAGGGEMLPRGSPQKEFDKIFPAHSLNLGNFPSSPLASLSRSCENNDPNVATDLSTRDTLRSYESTVSPRKDDSEVLVLGGSTRTFSEWKEKVQQGRNLSGVPSPSVDGSKVSLDWNKSKHPALLDKSESLPPAYSQPNQLCQVIPAACSIQSRVVCEPELNPAANHVHVQPNVISTIPTKNVGNLGDHQKVAGEVSSSESKSVPSTKSHSVPAECGDVCKDACCPYLKKLKDLRRNVYRMLCVFTPYLGVANINDYEADSIDEFLHEVIYSKLDDSE